MVNAQEWLDKYFPKTFNRKKIPRLSLSKQNLEGCLDLTDFVNLKELGCSENHQLTEIKLPKGESLEVLYLSDNGFHQDLSFLKDLVSLKKIHLDNNKFIGSLEYLKEMERLKELNINNTNIDSGLEYLPDSVEVFSCSAYKIKDARCKTIFNLFANEEGEVETEQGNIKNFPQKLQAWKQVNPELVITRWKKEAEQAKEKVKVVREELETELQVEREEFNKALQKAQEWRERQLSL